MKKIVLLMAAIIFTTGCIYIERVDNVNKPGLDYPDHDDPDPDPPVDCRTHAARIICDHIAGPLEKYCNELTEEDYKGVTHLRLRDKGIKCFNGDEFQKFTNLTHIEMTGDVVQALREGMLSSLNLRKITISDDNIKNLPQDIFKGTNPEKILIIARSITTLPDGIFAGLTKLQELYLYGVITTLPDGVFSGLSNLSSLILQGNQLRNIKADVFDSLHNLGHLNLTSNGLTWLPTEIFASNICINRERCGVALWDKNDFSLYERRKLIGSTPERVKLY